jgi:hypothetical protein
MDTSGEELEEVLNITLALTSEMHLKTTRKR